MAHEADAITEELRQLYLMLEAKQIAEADFDAREGELLDRLDRVREREANPTDEAEDAEEDQGGEDGSDDEEKDEEDDDADGGGGA
ncbi:MAG: gas vesicle protein GvpG, partial [Gemmatimonadetes bacterium]|nr:gas vesicle protein GvpG [Gemmatimonadota bacterium]